MLRIIASELRKSAALPSTRVAGILSLVVPPAIAALNAGAIRAAIESGQPGGLAEAPTIDAGFLELLIGSLGPVVIGVALYAAEFRRADESDPRGQITTTLLVCPRRTQLFFAKGIAAAVIACALALVAVPATVLAARMTLGPHASPDHALAARGLGAGLWWMLTAIAAFAIATTVRNGILPLMILTINGTAVSFSHLLSLITPLARFLPDLAGTQMFVTNDSPLHLGPVAGGAIAVAWTAAWIGTALVSFNRLEP